MEHLSLPAVDRTHEETQQAKEKCSLQTRQASPIQVRQVSEPQPSQSNRQAGGLGNPEVSPRSQRQWSIQSLQTGDTDNYTQLINYLGKQMSQGNTSVSERLLWRKETLKKWPEKLKEICGR